MLIFHLLHIGDVIHGLNFLHCLNITIIICNDIRKFCNAWTPSVEPPPTVFFIETSLHIIHAYQNVSAIIYVFLQWISLNFTEAFFSFSVSFVFNDKVAKKVLTYGSKNTPIFLQISFKYYFWCDPLTSSIRLTSSMRLTSSIRFTSSICLTSSILSISMAFLT